MKRYYLLFALPLLASAANAQEQRSKEVVSEIHEHGEIAVNPIELSRNKIREQVKLGYVMMDEFVKISKVMPEDNSFYYFRNSNEQITAYNVGERLKENAAVANQIEETGFVKEGSETVDLYNDVRLELDGVSTLTDVYLITEKYTVSKDCNGLIWNYETSKLVFMDESNNEIVELVFSINNLNGIYSHSVFSKSNGNENYSPKKVDDLTINSNSISIKPNPAVNQITVGLNQFRNEETIDYTITDLMGRTLLSGSTKPASSESLTVEIGLLTDGTYLFSVGTSKNLITQKLIVAKDVKGTEK